MMRPTRDIGPCGRRADPAVGTSTLIGLVTLYDPPRPDAKQLIAVLRDLGVIRENVDRRCTAVAREIAQGVGCPTSARVADLKAGEASKGIDLLAGADGFAEVYPEDK